MDKFWLRTMFLFCFTIGSECKVIRQYFVQIEEIEWNYAPTGRNVIQNRSIDEDEIASIFLQKGKDRIGPAYKKAVYVQYTDATFTTRVEKPKWLGFLGPVMAAEEGDIITVCLRNSASRPYSMHPHGVSYEKDGEGAFYPDGTSQRDKEDDKIEPGHEFTYFWEATFNHGPSSADANCVTRFYHSHVSTVRDINSGLIGPLIICKKGTLEKCANVAFSLFFMVMDENESWYIDDNINTYIVYSSTDLKNNPGFIESNKMHAINGFMFGNLPGLTMCQGDRVQWNLFSLGNEVDMHSVHFHGQVLTAQNHHTDTISLFPASSVTAEMDAGNIGNWLLTCNVNDHLMAGMQALFEIRSCFVGGPQPMHYNNLRQYYIAAEELIWNYAPIFPKDSKAKTYVGRGPNRIGRRYKKVRYVEYTDGTFSERKECGTLDEHLGILGPVIPAEEGDLIKVVFKNSASRPYSIQPHGVQYNIDQEGTLYYNHVGGDEGQVPAASVQPGDVFTYEWSVPLGAGPVEGEPDCLSYLYYSAVNPVRDTSSGLVGPLLICRPGSLRKGFQKNYDREFHLLATVFDENLSWYIDENIQEFTTSPNTVDKEDEGFQESNKMNSINGYVYRNVPGLDMCKGDKVTWHVSALGTETDVISIYFQGNRVVYRQIRRDTVNVFPHISRTVTMEPDAMGYFEVVSATQDQYHKGMRANYTVGKRGLFQHQNEVLLHSRTYYIAAVEVIWDYSPSRTWEMERFQNEDENPATVFLDRDPDRIGSRYIKVVYRQFTDSTFTEQVRRSRETQHLGIMGPIIHANIGEKVKIVFKNMASRPYSIHAHGVKTLYSHVYETQPGEVYTYVWYINKNTGPTHKQEECSVSAYYSTANIKKDLYSGLIGPLVICHKNAARKLHYKNVKEFAVLFLIFDENESWYLEDNIRRFVNEPRPDLTEDEYFIESNKMHAINGYVYCNLHLKMAVGDKVYWHLLGMGSALDIHTVHWHGHSVDYKLGGSLYQTDGYELFPATFQTTKMILKFPGTWLFHCHVNDHLRAGMEALYTVTERSGHSHSH